jgi:predicted transcriptional regulator
MLKLITDKELRADLKKRIRRGESQTSLAKRLRVSQAFLSQYLSGQRPHASDRMLLRLGYNTIRYYVPLNDD